MGGFPFTPLEILEIGVIMILALPFIVIGIAASCIVHLLQYPLRDLGYTQKLTPVRASRSEYAVVTGASKGLGRDVALKLARDGWSLVIAARNPDLLADLKRSIEDLYGKDCKVIPVACDLGSDGGRRTLENVVKDLPITLVVLNAGCAYTRDLVNVSEQKMRDMLGINVEQQTYLSHYFLTQHFVPGGRGRLCIVSSIVAYSLGSANSLYFSAKSYLSQFGRSLAHECRSLGCGVLTIQPGAMADTNFSSAGDCENSAIFKLPGAQMSSADVAEELVRRLQADGTKPGLILAERARLERTLPVDRSLIRVT
ncbi:hypothetical protein FOZ61_007549 [Perkinsus olseni]|uniref:Dehydrogenase reductase SDR member 7B n=1 Tax=Perkinsus olseni TaxID=32597 RepID=A0A7J6L8F7_PEROL|nr:hypothetical protein FOL46_009042 [Perkinsus olseni]KAF4655488.1 hypothetical protein FOZ61_007549 [Perkinsus olseni]